MTRRLVSMSEHCSGVNCVQPWSLKSIRNNKEGNSKVNPTQLLNQDESRNLVQFRLVYSLLRLSVSGGFHPHQVSVSRELHLSYLAIRLLDKMIQRKMSPSAGAKIQHKSKHKSFCYSISPGLHGETDRYFQEECPLLLSWSSKKPSSKLSFADPC